MSDTQEERKSDQSPESKEPVPIGGLPLTRKKLRRYTALVSPEVQLQKRKALEMQTESEVTNTASTQAQITGATRADYRHQTLSSVGIYIQFDKPLPPDTHAQIEGIIGRGIDSHRITKLSEIAKDLQKDFKRLLSATMMKIQYLVLLERALKLLDDHGRLDFLRGEDWDENLVPPVQENPLDKNYFTLARDNPSQPTPSALGSNSGPKAEPGSPVNSVKPLYVKTPSPDITIGYRKEVMIPALAKSGKLSERYVTLFLKFGQKNVGGKGYSTEGNIYEAQNQAGVSAACALNMLYKLNDSAGIASHSSSLPLVFSICTQGPIHELWAHYSTVESGFRRYDMRLIAQCNVVIQDGLLRFMKAIDNVMTWGVGDSFQSVIERLVAIAIEQAARTNTNVE